MNVLFITRPIVPPWNEGSKNLAWQIAKHLQRHRPNLLTNKSSSWQAAGTSIALKPVYSAASLSTRQKLRLLLYLLLRPQNIDLYHYFFVPTPATSVLLSALSRLHGMKTVQTVPSLYADGLTKKRAHRLFFADRVVAISDLTADKLCAWGIENVVRINVGIDVGYWATYSKRLPLQEQFDLPQTATTILFAGEYGRLGAIEKLLEIIPQVLVRCPHCHFIFACRILRSQDVEIRDDVQRRIRSNDCFRTVHFLDEVHDFAALLKACDVLLFPVSDMTGKIDTPLTVLEAMAAGLPIVLTDVAPLNEIFVPGAGAMVPVNDEQAMIEAVVALVNNVGLRQQAGRIAQEAVKARYDLWPMVRAYEELYDSLA